MDENMMDFDRAVENFLQNPGQETYGEMLNAMVTALYGGADVQAVVVAEKDDKGPLVRLRRLTAGNRKTFSIYTTAEKAKASPFHTDSVRMSLNEVVRQTLREPGIAGLVVNPGEGTDVMIPLQVLRMAWEAAKNLENTESETVS